MRKISRLQLIGGGVAVGLAILMLLASNRSEPAALSTAIVSRGNVEESVLATGSLQPAQLVSVGAQVSGRLVSLRVALGDHVRKGQIIATIDPVPATNALKTAQAALAQVIAQRASQAASLSQAQIALKRQKITLAADASSRADFDAAVATENAARANLQALDAQVAQARVNVDIARVNLGYTNIVAPIEGDVLYVVTKQGQTVNAVQAAPTIVILGDVSTMTVKAQISEADVPKIRESQPSYFTILGDAKRRFYGRLRSIAPAPTSIVNEVNSATSTSGTSSSASSASAVYYDGLIDVPNADGVLKTDMTVQVSILVAQAKDVVAVPAVALDPPAPTGTTAPLGPLPDRQPPSTGAQPSCASEQHVVLVVGADGRPLPRRICTGLNNNVTAEVLSGLQPGDRVVTGQATVMANGQGGGRMPPPPGMF